MEESILKQSKRAKGLGGISKKWKLLIIVLLLAGGSYYAYSAYTKNTKSAALQLNQQKSATVTRGDIQLAVESDGTVTAEDGVELSFSTTGETVDKIYVKEGDTVKQGDKIASITTTSLNFSLKNAQDTYQSALLALSDGKAGATDKQKKDSQYQIEQAQTNLDQAKTSLDQTKIDTAEKEKNAQDAIDTAQRNLKLNSSTDSSKIVDDSYTSVYNDVEALILTLKNHQDSADKILGIDDSSLNDKFEKVLGATNSSYLYSSQSNYDQLKVERSKLEDEFASTNKTDHSAMDSLVAETKNALALDKTLYTNLQGLLDNTITYTGFTQSDLDSLKSGVASTRSSINSSTTALNKDVDAIDTAKDSLDNLQTTYDKAVTSLDDVKRQNVIDLSNAETAIRNKEIALDQANMSYNDLLAPLTTSELQNLVSKVNQAKNNLDEVQDKINQATLTSPIDGQVGAINGKEGSLISDNNTKSFATIINKDTLFVKVNVEESDISSIKKGQKAYITFDALSGLEMEGQVTFISMTAATSNSGVVTYEVRVVLSDVGKTEVKEGMTAFVKFINSEAKDVLSVPVAAVTNVKGVASVKMADGSYQEVVTGFTDGKTVEIVSGLKEGDKITY
jgi:RND family efflux transporter MFP subunit